VYDPNGIRVAFGRIVMEIEAAMEPRRKGNAIKHDGANKRRSAVTPLFQKFSPWRMSRS
jgi:hypothetical protein